jgi:hypothetical protein
MNPEQREMITAIQKQLTTPLPPLKLGDRVVIDAKLCYAVVIGLWSDGYAWKVSACFATGDEYQETDTQTAEPHVLTLAPAIPPEVNHSELLNRVVKLVEEAPPRLNLGQVVKLRSERFGVVIGIDGGDEVFEDGWTYLISYAQPTVESVWYDYQDLESFVLPPVEDAGMPLMEWAAGH